MSEFIKIEQRRDLGKVQLPQNVLKSYRFKEGITISECFKKVYMGTSYFIWCMSLIWITHIEDYAPHKSYWFPNKKPSGRYKKSPISGCFRDLTTIKTFFNCLRCQQELSKKTHLLKVQQSDQYWPGRFLLAQSLPNYWKMIDRLMGNREKSINSLSQL